MTASQGESGEAETLASAGVKEAAREPSRHGAADGLVDLAFTLQQTGKSRKRRSSSGARSSLPRTAAPDALPRAPGLAGIVQQGRGASDRGADALSSGCCRSCVRNN